MTQHINLDDHNERVVAEENTEPLDAHSVIEGRLVAEEHRHMEPSAGHTEIEDRLARSSGLFLDRADTYIYAIVGVCFLIGALLALGYTFWAFGIAVVINIPAAKAALQPAVAAQAIIEFISGLLLVLIIMEVLGTVIHYLKSHETSLRPFLFIGIVSATRSILSIGAKLSVGGTTNFNEAMIELGVSAAVVLALGVTLKILGKLVDGD